MSSESPFAAVFNRIALSVKTVLSIVSYLVFLSQSCLAFSLLSNVYSLVWCCIWKAEKCEINSGGEESRRLVPYLPAGRQPVIVAKEVVFSQYGESSGKTSTLSVVVGLGGGYGT
jgi:hypothetical protein